MPQNYIDSLVKKGKGTKEKLEQKWNKAKNLAEYQNQPDNYKYITSIFNHMVESEELEEDGDGGAPAGDASPVGNTSSPIMNSVSDMAFPMTKLGMTHKRKSPKITKESKLCSFKDYVLFNGKDLNEGLLEFDELGAIKIGKFLELLKGEILYHLVGDDAFLDNIDAALKRMKELLIQNKNMRDEELRKSTESKIQEEDGTDFSLAFNNGLKDYETRVSDDIKKNLKTHIKDMGER